jgi:hypothetical protein
MRTLATLAMISAFALQLNAKAKPKCEKDVNGCVPVEKVMDAVITALDEYQLKAEDSQGGLPKLVSAVFDFKTVVDTKGSGGGAVYIFKIGASLDKQQTTDLVFTYKPKAAKPPPHNAIATKTLTLRDQLMDTIEETGKIVKSAPPPQHLGELEISQVDVTLSFGVSKDFTGGISLPINIVTVTASLDRNSNAVQQVKLTFSDEIPRTGTTGAAK